MNAHSRDFRHIEASSLRFMPLLLLRWLRTVGEERGCHATQEPRVRARADPIKVDLQTGQWGI